MESKLKILNSNSNIEKIKEYIEKNFKKIKTNNFIYDELLITKNDSDDCDVLFFKDKESGKYNFILDNKESNIILRENFINSLKIKFRKHPIFFKSIIENDDYLKPENFINNEFIDNLYDLVINNKNLFNFNNDIKEIEKDYNVNLIKNFKNKALDYLMIGGEFNHDKYYEIFDDFELIYKLSEKNYRKQIFDKVKEKVLKINNLPDLIKRIRREYLEDIIKIRKPYFEKEKIIKNYFKNEYSKLLNKKNEDLILNGLKSGIIYTEFKNEFLKKIKIYDNEDEFFVGLNKYIIFKSGWDYDYFYKKFLDNNVIFKEIDENKFLVKIENYEQSKNLGSSQWCISYDENHFKTYKKNFYEQYFLYDFNLSPDDGNSLIGITLNTNSEIENIHNRFDNFLDGRFFSYIFENLKNEDYILNKILNENTENINKIFALIKKGNINKALNIIDCNSYQEFNEKVNEILNDDEINENHIKILAENNFFENVDNLNMQSLFLLFNNSKYISNLGDIFKKSYNKLSLTLKNNLLHSILIKDKNLENNEIKDLIIFDFLKEPLSYKFNMVSLIKIFIDNQEKYLHKVDIKKVFDPFIEYGSTMLNNGYNEKINSFINDFNKNDLKIILLEKIKRKNLNKINAINDKIFDEEIEKIGNAIFEKGYINLNIIYNEIGDNKLNTFLKNIVENIIKKDEKLIVTSESNFLYNNDIRELILKNNKISTDEYFIFLYKRTRKEKIPFCDSVMLDKVLSHIEKNYNNKNKDDIILKKIIDVINNEKKQKNKSLKKINLTN